MTTHTYELIATPAEHGFDTFVYQTIEAGICGPFTEVSNFLSLEEAEEHYFGFGIVKVGNWTNRGGSLVATAVAR